MIQSIMLFFFPDIKRSEIKKFALLGLAFFFTIGTYWLLRLLKDIVLYKVAFSVEHGWPVGYGREIIPYIKACSPIVVLILLGIYTSLIDRFEKHKLFYIIASFYILIFSYMTCLFLVADMYGFSAIGKYTLATASIISYLATESFGSLIVALFWSFTTSSTTTQEAKRAYPFIFASGQFGAILGSVLLLFHQIPLWILYSTSICTLFAIMAVIAHLAKTVPASHMQSDHTEIKKKPDFFAGIRLITTQPYLMGVFVISNFYEVARTLVEYQMKSQADVIANFNFHQFIGMYGVCVNILAFLIALLGTSFIIKKLGIQICLLIYPTIFGIALLGLYSFYMTGPEATTLLWATFITTMIITATAYAVNNPTKEMMYIPTSNDVKFKSKGIIDVFGSRTMKFMGAHLGGYLNVINNPVQSIANLMAYGTLSSLGIIGLWIIGAVYVGKKNTELVKKNLIIQ